MACEAIHNWTFSGLVGAFLDLVIAYVLLCASTVAFFAAKFLGVFGLCLPCPCNGLFSSPNRKYCAQQLLFDCPIGQVSSVQFSAKNKFPFDSIFANDPKSDSNMKRIGDGSDNVDGIFQYEIGKEAVDTKQNYVKESRFDLKDKGVISQHYVNRQGVTQSEENVAVQGGSVSLDATQCYNVDERGLWSEPPVKTEPNELKGDEENTIVVLKKKLEDLYMELEEERNAAATAADEAMAMILRLQEEKALIEMEARQYQRMIEEKAAYDLEEMNILKEILLRREREKHFLEKEAEAYRRQMNYENKEEIIEGSFRDPHEDQIKIMLHQLISESTDNNNPIRGWDEYGDGSKQGNLEREFSKCVSDDYNQELHEKKMISEASSQEDKQGQNGQSVVVSEEVRVHDVHVVDVNRNRPTTTTGLPLMDPRVISHLGRNSTSALDTEKLKIESEVGWLRERLRVVQQEREKLNLSVEYREKEKLQLQLLEDILLQLQEIRQWTDEPQMAVHQVSLPVPSSKIISRKRRCQSVSLGADSSS